MSLQSCRSNCFRKKMMFNTRTLEVLVEKILLNKQHNLDKCVIKPPAIAE